MISDWPSGISWWSSKCLKMGQFSPDPNTLSKTLYSIPGEPMRTARKERNGIVCLNNCLICTVVNKKKFLFRFVKRLLQTVPLAVRFRFKFYYYCLAVAIIRVTDNVRAIPARLLSYIEDSYNPSNSRARNHQSTG